MRTTHPRAHSNIAGAPEVLRNERYNMSADLYSYGILLVEIMLGNIDDGRHVLEQFLEIKKKGSLISSTVLGWRPRIPMELLHDVAHKDAVVDLAKNCWHRLPLSRPKAFEVVRRLRELAPPNAQLSHSYTSGFPVELQGDLAPITEAESSYLVKSTVNEAGDLTLGGAGAGNKRRVGSTLW